MANKRKTKKNFEIHLNQLYADLYTQEQALDNFLYLANRSRVNCTTSNGINAAFANHTLGTLLRKYDPIAFNVQYNEWK